MGSLRSIEVLNKLIQINNDRIKGYQAAWKKTKEDELKALFHDFISNSRKCKGELQWQVISMGGTPTQSTMISGRIFRVWMAMTTALIEDPRDAILKYCVYGEEQALNTYDKVLNQHANWLSRPGQNIVKEQYDQLRADHAIVKNMRLAQTA
jgi:uncharacterized protein (TIGR02284 family)